jgi:hypothetical protein
MKLEIAAFRAHGSQWRGQRRVEKDLKGMSHEIDLKNLTKIYRTRPK